MIAYETWRKGSQNAPDIDQYMPIGVTGKDMTKEELDEIWESYGTLRKGKFKKLVKYKYN